MSQIIRADDAPFVAPKPVEVEVSPFAERVDYDYTLRLSNTLAEHKRCAKAPYRSLSTDAQKAKWRASAPMGEAKDYNYSLRRYIRAWFRTTDDLPPAHFIAATASNKGFQGDGVLGSIRAPWVRAYLRVLRAT